MDAEFHPMIYGCNDCGLLMKLKPWEKVRCKNRACQSDDVTHLKTMEDVEKFEPQSKKAQKSPL